MKTADSNSPLNRVVGVPHGGRSLPNNAIPGGGRRALQRTANGRFSFLSIALIACFIGPACSQYHDPNVPELIRPVIEPEQGRQYLLYRPSSYDSRRRWPLVVVCHGSSPDSPNRQIRDWTQLAEEFGFLVLAPRLESTRSIFPPGPEKQLPRQRADEEQILAAIRHVRAGHSISEDRILIHGFAGGAYAALPVGLRHPELFRAISLAQPKFKEEYLADVAEPIDRFQPIYLSYSLSDTLTGKHARRCKDWLHEHGANLREDASSKRRQADCRRAVEFLENVIRREPWIQIRAFPADGDNPLELKFKLRASFTPKRYLWTFGDGDESPVAQPKHVYAAPGTYRVSVTVEGPKGYPHKRTVTLKVPTGQPRPADIRPNPSP
jgi:predicted esterase